LGLVAVALFLVAGFLAPLPYDPLTPDTNSSLLAPSGAHWFGTDSLGRDVFSRTIVGARLDVPLSLAGTLLSLLIGVPCGLLASTKGRWSDRLMRGLDMFQAFPLLVLAVVIVALTGNNLHNIVFAIGLINIPRFIRLVRSEALSLRESRFVEAAVAIGASPVRIMSRHLLPNMTATILVQASLTAAQAIVVIASLSFLGIGITPPTATWGGMIQTGSQNITSGQWWTVFFPGLAVFAAVFSFNQIADGIDRSLSRGAR
jgi:peptide/nickel transport system permease protein